MGQVRAGGVSTPGLSNLIQRENRNPGLAVLFHRSLYSRPPHAVCPNKPLENSMKLRVLVAALVTANLLTACGGGGGGDSPAPDVATAATTSLRGLASKGLINKAVVKAYAVDAAGLVATTPLAEYTTGEDGAYVLDLGRYTGAVKLVVTTTAGSTTKDEATGAAVALPSDFTLNALTEVKAPAAGATGAQTQSASVTPFTELAFNVAKDAGALTPANIAKGTSAVFTLIGFDPVSTRPIDSAASSSSSATDAEKRYALFNAAVSQLATAAPTTTDATTTACFTAAGSDAGKKINCAVQQLATAVTVTPLGSSSDISFNQKLVGFAGALVAAAANPDINKTGAVLTTDDSVASSIRAAEAGAAAGQPVKVVVTTEAERSDIVLAKRFFSNLRSNAAAMQDDALNTGVANGLQSFGDSLNSEAAGVTQRAGDTLRLAQIAQDLWTKFKSGAQTNPNNVGIPGFAGGCTVFESEFPTAFVGVGIAAAATSVNATSAATARWVGCSTNVGVAPTVANKATQYRQSILFNMSASTYPAAVPYIAVTRSRFLDATNAVVQQSLTPTLSGTLGYVLDALSGEVTGFSLKGDLPPAVTATGTLLAARYPIDVNGAVTLEASGAVKAGFSAGKLGVVRVGEAEAALSVDLSPGGRSFVVLAQDETVAAQRDAQRASIAGVITTARGTLTGDLLIDTFTLDANGEAAPGHLRFSGSLAVAASASASPAQVFNGSLDVTNGSRPAVTFDGVLALAQRPTLTLKLSIVQTPATAAAAASYTLNGSYVQGGLTVALSATQTGGSSDSATFADASGVSVSVSKSATSSPVTVGGRATAQIDRTSKRITYRDGSFESLI